MAMTSVVPGLKLYQRGELSEHSKVDKRRDPLSSHVQVHVGFDLSTSVLIRSRDRIASKQTRLLASVEVELDSGHGLEAAGGKRAEGLHEVDDT